MLSGICRFRCIASLTAHPTRVAQTSLLVDRASRASDIVPSATPPSSVSSVYYRYNHAAPRLRYDARHEKIENEPGRNLMIVLFQLATAPVLILCLTLLARRFGPAFGGLIMGVPLVTGPISIFTAIEQGLAFAGQAAIGNLVGQVSTCLFCFAYARSAKRLGVGAAICGVAVFFAATAAWSLVTWTLLPALTLLVASLAGLAWAIPTRAEAALVRLAPRWDLAARIIIAAAFVFAITGATRRLGPS